MSQVKTAKLQKPGACADALTRIAIRDGRWTGFLQQFPVAAAELLRKTPVLLQQQHSKA